MSRLIVSFVGATIASAVSLSASAATLAHWNFNAQSSPSNPTSGTGTIAGFGSTLAFGLTPNQSGSPGDTNPVIISGSPNNSQAGRTGAAIGSASGIRGVDIKTSTVGYEAPTVSWHLAGGYRTTRYYQILATSDGVNYSPVPTGTGSAATTLGSGTQLVNSATVSNTGLVTFISGDGLILVSSNGNGFAYPLSFTFPTGTVYDNNPNFGVRIVSIWDPNGSDYVSSFAGTTSADTTKGYSVTSSVGGGTVRYDMVTVSANLIPEPSTFALAGLGGYALLRRRAR